jgi:phosphoribosylaminoimidazole-succinocarboxamide synthase
MTADATPIAYTALQPGTPVQSADGQEFGTVEAVLVVDEVDVFDGIVVSTTDGSRFVDADSAGQLTTAYVRTTLSADEASRLPPPDDSPVFGVDATADTGSSIGDRFGRMFGRGRWKRE